MSPFVASLDVFDTVLLRRVGLPRDVFLLAGRAANQHRLIQTEPAAFAAHRVAAEAACRKRAFGGEIKLDEISRELARRLDFNEARSAELSALELAAERGVLCSSPLIREWIRELRRESPQVIFVSDMYLPSVFIRERLIEHGCWEVGDRLYVSNEHNASKVTGELFRFILEREGVPALSLRHFGNHANSDVSVPARAGIQAEHRSDGNLNRYEQRLETFAAATSGHAGFHAGASRLCRFETAMTGRLAAIRDVSAGVAGPVLTSYVAWVLREARRLEIARLYFVARDGSILLEIAKLLGPQIAPQVGLHYLHGSRQAWHLPGIFELGARELDWLFSSADSLSIATLCARLEFMPADLAEPLLTAGFQPADWERNLSPAERSRLRDALQLPASAAKIAMRAADARARLVRYLGQEGLLGADRCALVDVGWHGRAQDSLAKVIRAAGGTLPVGFYFGLNSGATGDDLGVRHAWLFDRRSGRGVARAIAGIEPLIETFCTDDSGATLGYADTGDRVAPVLRAERPALRAWGWATHREAVVNFARHFSVAATMPATDDAVRDMSAAALKLFWQTPTRAEAGAWGAFPYEDDQGDTEGRPLAAPLEWTQASGVALHGATGAHRAAWFHGSEALTPGWRRGVIGAAYRLRMLARAAKRGGA